MTGSSSRPRRLGQRHFRSPGHRDLEDHLDGHRRRGRRPARRRVREQPAGGGGGGSGGQPLRRLPSPEGAPLRGGRPFPCPAFALSWSDLDSLETFPS
ncbi:hypothetical protein DUI70_4486 [Streptomyces albus]|nr:hypothetical protein DUI70_4486 [Streptomyces albus]